jgi:copper chaperone CopZ
MGQPEVHHQIQADELVKNYDKNKARDRLAWVLFILGLAVYLTTRLIRLPDFPIYFFTDEAIQTQQAADLVNRGFRGDENILLPTYFKNGGQYNLSLSVYAQVLPYLIFGKSVWVTRGVSVLLSLTAAICLGLILRDNFKSRYWWLGPLLLAAVPAWFLHSRTAFETVIMASMYGGFMYFYLRYRQGKPRSLYLALLFGALSFYAYSPGQVIIVVTGLLLLISDAKYHWQHRKTALWGLGLLALLALPYLRFLWSQGEEFTHHLTVLNSYWIKPIPLHQKILTYFINWLKGFNPFYWFWPNPSIIEILWPDISLPAWLFSNQGDLERHIMKGYGHILLATFPFWVAGLARCIKRFKDPAHRLLLLTTLAAPTGAAVVDWGITRGIVFVIPTTLITALGIEDAFHWLQRNWRSLGYSHLASLSFIFIAGFCFLMLGDSLTNGPTWHDDYGLGGMQYGAQPVFTRAVEIAEENPNTTVFVSSTWANGTSVLMRYFTDDLVNVKMGNINAYGQQYKPLDRNMLFVMTGEDLIWINESGKFKNVLVEETLPYPDGSSGFFFVRLEYVENIEAILAEERETRQALISEKITVLNQEVTVQYPTLDMNEITHAFDGDPTTLIRTLEANPMRLILTFPEANDIQRLILKIGGTPTRLTVTALVNGEEVGSFVEEVDSSPVPREITVSFENALTVDELIIEVLNVNDGEIAHVHLWEVTIE